MESSTHFDLQVAITQHLQEIDQNHLLNHEEWDELFDHFLDETEALSEKGLTEREAFTVSKLRFGDITLVQQEYERAKPFGNLRKTLIVSLLLTFSVLGIIGLLNISSAFTLYLMSYVEWSASVIRYGDLGLKLALIAVFYIYAIHRLKEQQFFSKIELIIIPIAGVAWPLISDYLLVYVSENYEPLTNSHRLMMSIMWNFSTAFVTLLSMLVLTAYILIFKEHKKLVTVT